MQCEGESEIGPLQLDAWRVVEAQHQISTRKLVDSDAEQHLLEQLIEDVKPALRPRTGRLHYLLFTPFRYPPLRNGSRFGSRNEPGIWYGSETQRAAFAEVAYYRLLFLDGTAADLGAVEAELTAFRASIRTEQGIDLTRPPFAVFEQDLASPTHYVATQELGSAMRAAGVVAFCYRSARDLGRGTNAAVISPAAFGRRAPRVFENWHCVATRERVEMVSRVYFGRRVFAYGRGEFLVAGVLPAPAL